MKRLVAIYLKLGDFKAADKGQMELYLRWLAKYEQEPGEASPLGIILCSGKKQEQIELLELDQIGIHVAEYLTELGLRATRTHPPITVAPSNLNNPPPRQRLRPLSTRYLITPSQDRSFKSYLVDFDVGRLLKRIRSKAL